MSFGGGFSAVDPAFFPGFIGGPLEQTLCANLMNYEAVSGRVGQRVVPEVARGFPHVSNDGRTYTFTVRRDFRFSNGTPVKAANFVAAINRDLRPELHSTAVSYLQDVVGADAVVAGKTERASGVRASGNKLIIRLRRPAPDLPVRMAMAYFCAVPTDMKVAPQGVTPPSSGPYYVAQLDQQTLLLKRNPYYRGHRVRNPSQILWLLHQPFATIPLQVARGDVDFGFMSPAASETAAHDYPTQFHVGPGPGTACLALNSDRPLFHNNPGLRQAVAYALDRTALAQQYGKFVLRPTDHFIPRDMQGFRDSRVYPLRPNLRRARALAAGHTRSGSAVMYIRVATSSAFARGQIVQANLAKIGVAVEIKVQGANQGTRGTPYDILDSGCQIPEYPDPYAILNLSFDGRLIRPTGNTNVSYFDDPRFNRRLASAARLVGAARYRAYGKLDLELARVAPAVAYAEFSSTAFVSKRIRCVRFNPAYGLSMGSVCLSHR